MRSVRSLIAGVLFCLVFALMFPAHCTPEADAAFVSDFNRTSLAGSWKIRQGDDAAYKKAEYDDANWSSVAVPSNLQLQFPAQAGEIFWYRKWFYLPPDGPTFPLGLELGKIMGDDEAYVNGLRIGGNPSARYNDLYLGKTRIYPLPSDYLRMGSYNLIAVRVRSVAIDAYGIYEGNIIVGNFETLLNGLIRREVLAMFFSAIFLVIGIYALFLFARRTDYKAYLYFGLGSIDTGVYVFYISQWRYILKMENFCDPRLYYLTTFFVVPFFLCFTYELFPRSNPETKREKWFGLFTKSLLGYTMALCLFLFLFNDDRVWESMNAEPNTAVIFIASCCGILYAAHKFDIKAADSTTMLCGCIVGFFGGVLETARQYAPDLPPYMGMWGVACCIFSQAMILSNRFLRLHSQVEEYSQSLERMVDERTDQLRKAEESRRRLLSNISHDLRMPISSVLGHVELMLEGVVDSPEQQRTYLQRIHAKMLGLNRLIQDLFELSKIESALTSFCWREIPAREVVRDTWRKYASDVKNAGCRLEHACSLGDETLVRIDADRMDQVFANLIANAIRYVDKGGRIMISCESAVPSPGENRRKVLFKVADNGAGIAPEDIPKVFDRFYRGSRAREETSEHSGLGLAIAKEIVEAHHGRIWIDDQVETGCTFCILLPAS